MESRVVRRSCCARAWAPWALPLPSVLQALRSRPGLRSLNATPGRGRICRRPCSGRGCPAETRELVLVMQDPDVPILGHPVVHALPGHGPHHYVFQMVALRNPLSTQPATFKAIRAACTGVNVLAFGTLTGTYER